VLKGRRKPQREPRSEREIQVDAREESFKSPNWIGANRTGGGTEQVTESLLQQAAVPVHRQRQALHGLPKLTNAMRKSSASPDRKRWEKVYDASGEKKKRQAYSESPKWDIGKGSVFQ
jgi:hypothetical protein